MGYTYGLIHVINRLHSSFRSVCGITSQGQMSFIGRARSSGPACLKQTLLRVWCIDRCIFHVYYLGLQGEHLG